MSEKGGARQANIAILAAPEYADGCELVAVEFD
jgi:hypothetical protein